MPGADDGGHSPTLLHRAPERGPCRWASWARGRIEPQLEHAEGFAAIAPPPGARRARPRLVDLGSGGGLPGLVVAGGWPDATLVLLEANGRRAAFLRRAVERLGLGDRVTVLEERAEVCGRREGLRAGFDGVLARSFGRPAVVAECAAPLLRGRRLADRLRASPDGRRG